MSSNRYLPIFSFFAGLAVGAAIALLYAPTSGEELRGQIRQEVDQRLTRASAEMDKSLKSIQSALEQTRMEMNNYFQQAQAKVGATKSTQPKASE